jgi:hypothetical protein
MNCSECNKNKSTIGEFCKSCKEETKVCRDCQKRLSIFEFEKNQKSIAGKISRRGSCRPCRSGKKPIPSKARNEFEKQSPMPPIGKNFTCPICQKTIMRQFKNDVVLDHSHQSGEIRGWICRQCNSSIGMLDENISVMERAILWVLGDLK